MKHMMRKLIALMALFTALCLLPACAALEDLCHGTDAHHGEEMQRYWDHSWPGQRRGGWS
jgi:hypothetical protein